jgi:amidase
VPAGYSPLGIGTETDGSLVQPVGRAALFALKPTAGSVPREGAWTLSTALGSIGAMTKSARDLAIMTAMIQSDEVRKQLPATGYISFLTKAFEGLKAGFVDPAIWKLPAASCPLIESVTKQLVSCINHI